MGAAVMADAGPPEWVNAPPDGAVPLRTPPYSAEAEQSLLGAILLDNAALTAVADLVADSDFFNRSNAAIFGACRHLIDGGNVADIITVFEYLRSLAAPEDAGVLPYLNALAQSVPSASNARRYAEIVRERSLLRRLIKASDEIQSAAFSPQGQTVDALLTQAEERLADLLRERHRKLPGSRIPLLSLDALRESSEAVRWLVKRVIPADAIGMLFGGSGTFKSFIALDFALHVAHGLPWLGRRTTQGPVLYLAAEGGAGLWPRIEAWHRARRLRWQSAPVHVVRQAVNLATDAWRVVDAAQAAGVTPAAVIVDTLSQTYGGEENSANEMAAYLRELGARFRALWACAVLLIHHSGHQATERPRGSSAIRANVDFMLGVFRDEKELLATVNCAKQKDGEEFEDVTFMLRPHELGTDEDGDKVSALVAWHLSSAEEVSEVIESEKRAGRGGKNQLLLSLLQNGMKERDLRAAFYDECGLTESEARKKAYQRAKAWAVKLGFIEVAEGLVITLKRQKGDT